MMDKELEILRQKIIDRLDKLNDKDKGEDVTFTEKLIESFEELPAKERMKLLKNYKNALKALKIA